MLKKPLFEIKEPKFTDSGSANLVCPYCQGKLKRFPQRRTNCPFCDRVIYSRSRPLDRRKVLLDEQEIEIIEKEWEDFNKYQQLTRVISSIIPEKPEILMTETFYELKNTFQREPGVVEILWEINTRMSEECYTKGLFEKYRYHLLFFADILTYDSRDKLALKYLSQVIYLDLNGVTNTKNVKGRKAFTERIAKKSVDLIAEGRGIKNKLNLSMEELKDEFISASEEILVSFTQFTPLVTPEDAWKQIARLIE